MIFSKQKAETWLWIYQLPWLPGKPSLWASCNHKSRQMYQSTSEADACSTPGRFGRLSTAQIPRHTPGGRGCPCRPQQGTNIRCRWGQTCGKASRGSWGKRRMILDRHAAGQARPTAGGDRYRESRLRGNGRGPIPPCPLCPSRPEVC